MFRLGYKLPDHGLDDADVAVQQPADGSSAKRDPQVRRKSDHDQAEQRAEASQEEDRLPTDSIREASPVHARQGLGQGERRDEEARVERRIFLAADLKALDEFPGIGEDGGESDGLCEANNGCTTFVSPMLPSS